MIFNDNLAIFDDRNIHTGARKLLPKRYRQIQSFIAQWEPRFIVSEKHEKNVKQIFRNRIKELIGNDCNVEIIHENSSLLKQSGKITKANFDDDNLS